MKKNNFDEGGILSRLLAENVITYRPSLRSVTKSVTSAILLQQMMYWWYRNGEKPFYKFARPCKHKLYKEGDSWTEELGFSYSEYTSALKNIGIKITKGVSKRKAESESIIIYWTDTNRLTWFQFNENVFESDLLDKSPFLLYLKSKKTSLTSLTETTTEITINDDEPEFSSFDEMVEDSEKRRDKPIVSAEEYKERTAEALQRGINKRTDMRDRWREAFATNPNWNTKANSLVLKSLITYDKMGQTVEVFADWWFREDWRGKDGQSPSPQQVMEFWPQAFSKKRKSRGEMFTEVY